MTTLYLNSTVYDNNADPLKGYFPLLNKFISLLL